MFSPIVKQTNNRHLVTLVIVRESCQTLTTGWDRHVTLMHESRRFPSPLLAPPLPRLYDEWVMAEIERRNVYRRAPTPSALWRRNVVMRA